MADEDEFVVESGLVDTTMRYDRMENAVTFYDEHVALLTIPFDGIPAFVEALKALVDRAEEGIDWEGPYGDLDRAIEVVRDALG